MAKMSRREVIFSGRVQGVGFRWTTAEIARQFSVTGFVKNLSDGRVQLVVEGSAAQQSLFLSEVREAMAGQIESETMDRSDATGEFHRFEITH